MRPTIRGFNEAEAMKPRMPGSGPRGLACLHRCFNEAEAMKPRMPGSDGKQEGKEGQLQ